MPEGTISFEVGAPVNRVWDFLSDMRKIGQCIPGVESIEIHDERRATWHLKVKLGPLSQQIRVETESLEKVPPSRAKFIGRADNMNMTGTIVLEPRGEGTAVTYTMNVETKGPLARIMDNFMKAKLSQQTQEFASNVKKSIES
ncbi:MAG: hypothetical protein A3K68_03880 [Euryarchaeota archaeon RBG_16_68_13]|nr:MAG: hypothetical protein A3K68_03880 [Euryarchaeota archaeon RBG_16_68_13]